MAVPVPPHGRLTLEPLRVEDAEEMLGVLADAGLHEFTGGSPPDLEDLRRRYRAQTRGVSPDGTQTWRNWVVRLRADGTAIGYVQVTVDRASRDAELAWVIGVPWQGHGYASEAVRSVVAALRAAGSRRLVAHVHPDHEASRRVAERAGLTRTGDLVDGEDTWEWLAPG